VRHVAIGLVMLASLVGCSPSPTPTAASAIPASNPASDPSPGLGTGRPGASAPARVTMLIVGPPGARQPFFSLEPTAPQTRTPVDAPAGRWTVVSAGSVVALTSSSSPTAITLAGLSGRSLVPTLSVQLPVGDRWSGGSAACVADDGSFLAADSGMVLALHDSSGFRDIAGQRNNRGSCTWLDNRFALWDAEDGSIVVWDRASNKIVRDPLAGATGRRLSSGGGRLCWVTATDELVVAQVTIDGGGPTLRAEIGRIEEASVGELSPDGRWLAVRYLDGSSEVIAVTDSALGSAAQINLSDDEHVAWVTADEP
jgi:hypothetical protein